MSNIRNRYLLLSDLCLLAAAPFLAYAMRFEGWQWSLADRHTASVYAPLSLVAKLAVFLLFGMYTRLWRHASIPDLAKVIQAVGASAVACAALGIVALPASGLTTVRVPMSVVIIDAFLSAAAVTLPRLLIRVLGDWPRRGATNGGRRALIVGAGAAGEMILRELLTNPHSTSSPSDSSTMTRASRTTG
jgi:FlaA1/EpsC-like NDP-sugar epimerase